MSRNRNLHSKIVDLLVLSRISRFSIIENDLHRMFFEKSKSMNLQQHQMRACFSRNFDKCNFENNNRFIQIRITSYFNANDFICFQNDRIRNFQIYTCLRKFFAQILDFDSRFSIFENFSFNFNLQTLSKTFRHLFV